MTIKNIAFLVIAAFFTACSGGGEKGEIAGTWLMPNPIDPSQSQGMTLHGDGSAESVGMATLLYQSWKMTGDTLILTYESIGNRVSSTGTDSLRIIKLDSDSLVVSNGFDTVGYKRSGTAD